MADTHDKNFICRVRKILKKYALPPPESILDAPPKKTCWKNLVKNATSNYWYKEWFKDTEFDRQYQEGWISEIRRRRFDTTASA